MPPTSSADLSLINDTQFLEELDRSETADGHVDPKARPRTRYADAFDALESGLPMSAGGPAVSAPRREHTPKVERPAPVAAGRAPAATHVGFVPAALVLIVCVAVGGATAALVLHDRVMQITASWSATR